MSALSQLSLRTMGLGAGSTALAGEEEVWNLPVPTASTWGCVALCQSPRLRRTHREGGSPSDPDGNPHGTEPQDGRGGPRGDSKGRRQGARSPISSASAAHLVIF